MRRLEQLTSEASQAPMRAVIAEAVDLVISVERTSSGRRVTEIVEVKACRNGDYRIEPC